MILALPERESPWWSKASRHPPSQEWRTWRRELFQLGAEKATSSDCKTVFPFQTTQRQCCSLSLEGRSDFMSPPNHTRSKDWKSKMLPWTWRRLFGLMHNSWPALRWWRAAPQLQPADLKEHIHHTSWTYLWAWASRIRYGHIQKILTFICGFSLTPPPPLPNIVRKHGPSCHRTFCSHSSVSWNFLFSLTSFLQSNPNWVNVHSGGREKA